MRAAGIEFRFRSGKAEGRYTIRIQLRFEHSRRSHFYRQISYAIYLHKNWQRKAKQNQAQKIFKYKFEFIIIPKFSYNRYNT